ncbi:hypothetical protein ADL19_26715 [Streptomyces purpurogeneiscleroticus]|nr:hypothetical protein ADL19_26715 [Streptomyces purpurogeneiscleroticus]
MGLRCTGFLAMGGALKKGTIRGNEPTGRDEQGNPFVMILPADPAIATRLAERGVEVLIAATPDQVSAATSLVQIVIYY